MQTPPAEGSPKRTHDRQLSWGESKGMAGPTWRAELLPLRVKQRSVFPNADSRVRGDGENTPVGREAVKRNLFAFLRQKNFVPILEYVEPAISGNSEPTSGWRVGDLERTDFGNAQREAKRMDLGESVSDLEDFDVNQRAEAARHRREDPEGFFVCPKVWVT